MNNQISFSISNIFFVGLMLVNFSAFGQTCAADYVELLYENFEGCAAPTGWTFFESNPGGNGQSDGWFFDDDPVYDDGIYVTDGEAIGSCWARYYEGSSPGNDRTTTVNSPTINVSSYENVQVSFYYTYENRDATQNDNMQLWIRSNVHGDLYRDGNSWSNQTNAVWLDDDSFDTTINLAVPPTFLVGTTSFQVFIKFNDGEWRARGFAFDDFRICGELACTLAVGSPTATPAPTCGGTGEVSVTMTTLGDGPYQISVNNIDYTPTQSGNTLTATGIPIGTYTELTVTDSKGCEATTNGFTIGAPPAINFAANGVIFNNATMCNGQGSVTIILGSTGTAPYEITLDGVTYSNLTGMNFGIAIPQGPYSGTIQITDVNGCTDTRTVNAMVGEPSLSANIMIGNPTCGNDNGTVNANVTGTGPYTYQWNDSPNNSTTASVSGLPSGTYEVIITDQGTNCTITEVSMMLVNQGNQLSLLPFDVQDSGPCDSTGTATVNHGTGDAVTYAWNDGQTGQTATGLPAGNYTVTVTNTTAGTSCTTTGTTTVNAPSSNIMFVTPTTIVDVTCPSGNDGSITGLQITGAIPPLTTVWTRDGGVFVSTDIDISDLIADDYEFLVIDANNCRATFDTTITEPDAFETSFDIIDVVCSGDPTGEIDLTVTGGTAPYTYFWGPNVGTMEDLTGLSAGNYFVTITDALACDFASTTMIETNPELTPTLVEDDPVSCNGGNDGAASVTATGGVSGYTYLWDNGATTPSTTGLTGGLHSVTVTDDVGCIKTSTIDVFSPDAISSSTTGLANASCLGASNGSATVSPSGGTPPYTYLWPDGQTDATITSQLDAIDYEVSITDANGCALIYTVSIGESAPLTPNATVDPVSCNGESNGQIVLNPSNGSGSYSYTWSTGSNANTINNLPAGTYMITVEDNNANCKAEETYTVIEPDVLVLAADDPDKLCGASIILVTASAMGGNEGYQYTWEDNSTDSTLNVNANQTYGVSVTDAKGCEAAYSFMIGSLASPTISNSDSIVCIADGESISINLDDYFDADADYEWTIIKNNEAVNPASFTTESGTTDDLLTQVLTLSGESQTIGELTIEVVSYIEDGSFRCDGETLRLHVTILPKAKADIFFVPNIIIQGEEWGIQVLDKSEGYTVSVRNRSGAQVHKGDLTQQWDGGNVQDGVYYYLITDNDSGRKLKTGAVLIQN